MNNLASIFRQAGFVLWALIGLSLYDYHLEVDNFFLRVALGLPLACWIAHLWSRIERAQKRTPVPGERA